MTVSRVARNGEVLQRAVGDQLVLYNPATDEAHNLNAVGTIVWHRLPSTEPVDIERLVAQLSEHFEVAVPQVRSDLQPLIDELIAGGLVVAS